jgi:signal transduction histidine kinase
VLLAARLTGEAAPVPRAAVDLRSLVNDAVASAAPAAELRGGSITVEAPDTPVMVMADKNSTSRILANLLSNATVYSDGAPLIRVTVGADGCVATSDRGVGVPAEMRSRIFDRFVRGDNTNGTAGTGLGLFVARRLAEEQGGTLTLQHSEPGSGSTFCLCLQRA